MIDKKFVENICVTYINNQLNIQELYDKIKEETGVSLTDDLLGNALDSLSQEHIIKVSPENKYIPVKLEDFIIADELWKQFNEYLTYIKNEKENGN